MTDLTDQSGSAGMNREAVAVFDNVAALEKAIDELGIAGFNRAQISVLADETAVEQKIGEKFWNAERLEDSPEAPRTSYVSKESIGAAEGGLFGAFLYVGAVSAFGSVVMSGGTLGAAIAAVALVGGASGAVGAVLAALLGRHHAEYLQTQIEHGGLLLWVRVFDAEQEKAAYEILRRNGGRDAHMHGARASD